MREDLGKKKYKKEKEKADCGGWEWEKEGSKSLLWRASLGI